MRSRRRFLAATAGFLFLAAGPARTEDVPENRFVFAQLRHDGEWDPYPSVWETAAAFLAQTTSLTPWPERRVLSLDDPALFESPFLLLAGRGTVSFPADQLQRLRRHLEGGGFLLIDDSEASRGSPFARSVLPAVEGLFPGASWEAVPPGDALFRSFFLLRSAAGRHVADPVLRGLRLQGRLAAVYCANDLLGAWARDPLGNYLFPCDPGGEVQRREAFKLLANAAVFSVTGTYKTDAVHQPFIERKLQP